MRLARLTLVVRSYTPESTFQMSSKTSTTPTCGGWNLPSQKGLPYLGIELPLRQHQCLHFLYPRYHPPVLIILPTISMQTAATRNTPRTPSSESYLKLGATALAVGESFLVTVGAMYSCGKSLTTDPYTLRNLRQPPLTGHHATPGVLIEKT